MARIYQDSLWKEELLHTEHTQQTKVQSRYEDNLLDLTQPRQLLKWVGNKQRSALAIASYIPTQYRRYYEPFIGTGAVLGVLAPHDAVAGDVLPPLIEIWQSVKTRPMELVAGYAERWKEYMQSPVDAYERIKARYNERANADDLLFLSRSCYGGVVRFRKDGYMSTPVGPHTPISPSSFKQRVEDWNHRVNHTEFMLQDFATTMAAAGSGDVVYCDPPYVYTQAILYGAQDFTVERLFQAIEGCVRRGAQVLLSLDGTKKSGRVKCSIDFPDGLFQREVLLHQGSSMLRRFQRSGMDMIGEDVSDRLLLTW